MGQWVKWGNSDHLTSDKGKGPIMNCSYPLTSVVLNLSENIDIHVYFLSLNTEMTRGRQGPHDDVIKWKHFPCYWPFVRGIHRSPVNSPHKGQWRGALILTLICVWINGCANNREAGDLRRYCAHYGVTVMRISCIRSQYISCHVIDMIVAKYSGFNTRKVNSIPWHGDVYTTSPMRMALPWSVWENKSLAN